MFVVSEADRQDYTGLRNIDAICNALVAPPCEFIPPMQSLTHAIFDREDLYLIERSLTCASYLIKKIFTLAPNLPQVPKYYKSCVSNLLSDAHFFVSEKFG
jgi:hypothetical protein